MSFLIKKNDVIVILKTCFDILCNRKLKEKLRLIKIGENKSNSLKKVPKDPPLSHHQLGSQIQRNRTFFRIISE